jgi:hypothetical protein
MRILASYLMAITLIVTLSACSALTGKRSPASISTKDELKRIITDLALAVNDPINSSRQCHLGLNEYYQTLFSLTSETINMDQLTGEQLSEVLQTAFTTRLLIKEKMKGLTLNNDDDQQCLVAIRDINRALRYVEDYLTEMYIIETSNPAEGKIEQLKFQSLSGEAPYLLVNPSFDFSGVEDLKSGDVILSRGNAYSSAAIARIGTTDAQFSHLSLVYRNEESGKLYTMEAHIEVGNVAEEISAHINAQNAREVVFRYGDSEVAHEAAKHMYEKIKSAQESGKNIRYDFAMDYHENKDLFCSEVIYDGYQHVSAGTLDIPLYKTKFHPALIPFLNKIGVNVNQDNIDTFDTFAPGDMEFDPRFELVAEWRNPAKIGDSRIKDAILTKLFSWMENDRYQFFPKGKFKLQSYFGWLMRRAPVLNRVIGLHKKFPLNMKPTQIQVFMTLDVVGEVLYKVIQDEQNKREHPMTPIEMFELLEEYRVKDLAKYQLDPKGSTFHHIFHPTEK